MACSHFGRLGRRDLGSEPEVNIISRSSARCTLLSAGHSSKSFTTSQAVPLTGNQAFKQRSRWKAYLGTVYMKAIRVSIHFQFLSDIVSSYDPD